MNPKTLALQDTLARRAGIERVLKPIFADVESAPNVEEWALRMGAARLTRRFVTARYITYEPTLWEGATLKYYRDTLDAKRKRRRAIQKHRADLQGQGVPPEEWHLKPFADAAQRRREREWLRYVKEALRFGWPINWESRNH